MSIVVHAVTFDEASVSITYMRLPRDIRADVLVESHTVSINRAKADYEDEILDVERAVQALLVDVLEDFDVYNPDPTVS